eukprot:NODE_671_length_4854_cov_0.553312.p9 type:complete len:106 gc:universal NODE_671_length_4854_cov_0.553312:929-612(-)
MPYIGCFALKNEEPNILVFQIQSVIFLENLFKIQWPFLNFVKIGCHICFPISLNFEIKLSFMSLGLVAKQSNGYSEKCNFNLAIILLTAKFSQAGVSSEKGLNSL